jgi:hypothetical protein
LRPGDDTAEGEKKKAEYGDRENGVVSWGWKRFAKEE